MDRYDLCKILLHNNPAQFEVDQIHLSVNRCPFVNWSYMNCQHNKQVLFVVDHKDHADDKHQPLQNLMCTNDLHNNQESLVAGQKGLLGYRGRWFDLKVK